MINLNKQRAFLILWALFRDARSDVDVGVCLFSLSEVEIETEYEILSQFQGESQLSTVPSSLPLLQPFRKVF